MFSVYQQSDYIFCMIESANFHSSPTKESVIYYGERDLNTPKGTFFFSLNLRPDFLPITINCLFSKSFYFL